MPRIPGSTPTATALLMVLILLLAMELGSLSTGAAIFAVGAQLAFLALCLVSIPSVTIREVSLLSGAALLTIAVLMTGGDASAIGASLELAAFFAVFIAALTAIRDVAARSRSVLAVGQFLTGQPAGRRFYATALGGHALGVFMNFGAVSLMGPMVQKSTIGLDGTPNPDLERRQISALIRGFAWVILWAPTTLTQALLLTIFTEVSWGDVAWLGLATGALMIGIGRAYDRWEWRGRPLPGPARGQAVPWRALGIVLGVCVALIATTFALSAMSGFTVAQSLIFVAPLISLLWLWTQPPPANATGPASYLGTLGFVFAPSAISLARSAVALGASGYIGRLAALSLPVDDWSRALDLAAMPGWLFLAALPVVITLGGQVALSPILIVVFIGELLQGLDTLPTGPEQIYFALSIGWALSMTASPNATATLMISGACNIPATRLTWSWNLRYGVLCYLAAVMIFVFIA